MAFPNATGNNNPNFHPREILFDPRRGMSARQHVSCGVQNAAAESELLDLLRQAQLLGASGKYTQSNVKPSLEYEFPGIPYDMAGSLSELFFDDWQMDEDSLTNTVFSNALVQAGLSYNDLCFFQRYAKLGSGTEGSAVVDSLNDDLANGLFVSTGLTGSPPQFRFPAYTTFKAELFLMIDRDQTEFLDPLPVLHHTACCSPGATYDSYRAYEMCIYKPAQLLSEVGYGWTYNLPGRLYSQITSFPELSAPANEVDWFTWGWLKMRQTQKTQTNFMIETHQEYKLNLWSNLYYDLR
jgi:hypothetical protein